jgi:hypothetical protein
MGTVGAGFSMSLDGFIAEPNDNTQLVFAKSLFEHKAV